MAYSNAEIVKFLIDNPQLTDAQLADVIKATGVSVSQIAEATVSKVDDIAKRLEEKVDKVYTPPPPPVDEPTATDEPAAPVAPPVAAPVAGLLDLPTVATVAAPPAAPIVETVAAPIAPVKEVAPTAPVAKTGTEQMVDLLIKNPNLTDAELVKAMQTYKVSPADLAKATVSDEGKISARVAATVPQGSSVTLGDTVIAPQYRITGSGMDEQIGPLETFTTSKSDGDVNYKAPVGTPVNIYSPTGELVNTVKTKKDLSFFGGLADMVNDPVVKAALMATGLPAGIGEAVGLGTGATATAVGTGLLNAGTTAATGANLKDVVKAGVIGGGASLLGSTVSDLLTPTVDASGLPADIGLTERQLAIADAKQLADQGLTVSQIKETLTANGYNDAIVGRAITAITPATTAPVTTAPVAPSVAADNVLVTAPNAVVPSTVPNLASVISTIAAPPIETVKVDAPRDKVTPTAPNLTSVINTIATVPVVKPPVETVTVEDKRIKEEDKKVTVPTVPTVSTTPIDTLTVTAPRPVVPTPTAPIVPTIPLVLPTIPATPPAPPSTPPKPPEPPPEDKKPPSIGDIIKIVGGIATIGGLVNAGTSTPTKPSFPIVPIPPEWKPPTTQPTTPFQPLTPIDFGNQNLLKGTQWEKFLDPNYGKVPAPTQYAQPSNLSYNDLMGILGSKQGMPPTSSLSINDVISGIQNQYGQVPSGAVGAKPA